MFYCRDKNILERFYSTRKKAWTLSYHIYFAMALDKQCKPVFSISIRQSLTTGWTLRPIRVWVIYTCTILRSFRLISRAHHANGNAKKRLLWKTAVLSYFWAEKTTIYGLLLDYRKYWSSFWIAAATSPWQKSLMTFFQIHVFPLSYKWIAKETQSTTWGFSTPISCNTAWAPAEAGTSWEALSDFQPWRSPIWQAMIMEHWHS